ncbi:protein FAM98A [Prorops nasuta]|uniref:protein FAM98A n=1 Tax=Prorops nasuta TaxID=863751 RepID=UPI0034CF06CA
MESGLLQLLNNIQYKGPLNDEDKLSKALKNGSKSVEFTELVAWLSEQLASFNHIDETIHPISSPDESSTFLLELSFFLKELGCVNSKLMTGDVNQRLDSSSNCAFLLEFLAAELMASKILSVNKPEEKTLMELTINESNTAKHLKDMLVALKFEKPPDTITPQVLFSRLETKLKEVINQVPPEVLSKPIAICEFSPAQWEKLSELQQELHKEYTIRREMLLKRLDVTIQSFLWSERLKVQEDEVNSRYKAKRELMYRQPNVDLADLLAAREDLAILEKTSNASVRKNTRSKVNSVIIGNVPDRGGRPYEQEPPPPEMPPWQKDRVAGPPSFRGGRGGGQGRGSGGSGGRGGGGGRGSGGYRDNKDAAQNFGQNINYQQQQQPQRYEQPQGTNYYSNNQGNRNYQTDNRGHYQGDNRYSGSYQSDSRTDDYQKRDEHQRGGGNRGRGGRVQSGWNQSGNHANSSNSGYQRGNISGGGYQRGSGGYNRGGRNQY